MTPLEYVRKSFWRLARYSELTLPIVEDAIRSGDLECVVFTEGEEPSGFALYRLESDCIWVSGLVLERGRLDQAVSFAKDLARQYGRSSLRFMTCGRAPRVWVRRLSGATLGDGYIELGVPHG